MEKELLGIVWFLRSGLAITPSAFGFTQLPPSVTIRCHMASPDPAPCLQQQTRAQTLALFKADGVAPVGAMEALIAG